MEGKSTRVKVGKEGQVQGQSSQVRFTKDGRMGATMGRMVNIKLGCKVGLGTGHLEVAECDFWRLTIPSAIMCSTILVSFRVCGGC